MIIFNYNQQLMSLLSNTYDKSLIRWEFNDNALVYLVQTLPQVGLLYALVVCIYIYIYMYIHISIHVCSFFVSILHYM